MEMLQAGTWKVKPGSECAYKTAMREPDANVKKREWIFSVSRACVLDC